VGQLFGQHLHHRTDGNGFESSFYLSATDNAGALRNVAYYHCPHCQAQYLLLYNDWLKDNRPPFEPDETHLVELYQVDLNHRAFLRAFHRVAPTGGSLAVPGYCCVSVYLYCTKGSLVLPDHRPAACLLSPA
jgi:hypothetical protein